MSTRDLPEIRLDKTKLSVVPVDDHSDEIEHWRNAPTKERLQHAERLRRIAFGSRATQRIHKTIEVVKLEER